MKKLKQIVQHLQDKKAQEGNYWDTFLNLDFDYDKRNQKFQTSDGFRSVIIIRFTLISETNTLTNIIFLILLHELYENNISSFSFYLESANSIKR